MRSILTIALPIGLLSLGVLGAACSSTPDAPAASSKSADSISDNDDPLRLLPNASLTLADNIGPGDVGQTFGTDDAHIPYPDTYWPFTDNGCDSHWQGDGTQSPLEKLLNTFDATDLAAGKAWEQANHGKDVPGVEGWFGHCPGWTGSAMLNAPLQHPIYVKSDGNGGVTSCDPSDTTCTKFEIGDLNALMAEVYVDADSTFIGGRCDTKPADIQRDANGRIVRTGGGCQGINPGSLLVVLGYQMKSQHQAMAIDAQNDFNTDQIWNQPAYRYTVYRYQPLTMAQAANLVASGSQDGGLTSYSWNTNAQGFVFVDLGVKWVSENGPNTTPVSGADSTHETRVVAVIELDKDASDPTAQILGGEYLDDPSVGADRLTVNPFVWIASAAGPDQPSGDGNGHNPYVHPSLVAQLVSLAQQ
jgi:hypothetical protein